jgi:hypothetical protein
VESELQDVKESTTRYSTDAGRQIDLKDEQPESALNSIRVSVDPGSNVNEESNSHELKE